MDSAGHRAVRSRGPVCQQQVCLCQTERFFSWLMHGGGGMSPCLLSQVTPPAAKESLISLTWPSYAVYWEPHYLFLHGCETSSPKPPALSLTLHLLSSHQHPEAQKQTSVTRRSQKSASVPSSAGGLQDPHGQEDTSSWHQAPTQTSTDARQGAGPDGHCSRCGNRPRTPAAQRSRGEKGWVWLPWWR